MTQKTDLVLLAEDVFSSEHIDRITSALEGWATWQHIGKQAAETEYRPLVQRAAILFGRPPIDWIYDSAVRYHQLIDVGYERYYDARLARKPDYVLCNAGGVRSVAMAEHFLALMFALVRHLDIHIRDVDSQHWQRRQVYAEVSGTQVCVLGLGGSGTEIVRRCLSLDQTVVGVRQRPQEGHPLISTVFGPDQLITAVAEADHVVACLPAGPTTNQIIDSRVFRAMKPGAYFYNIGRGQAVDEAALLTHLQSGHLAGAGLDVFSDEPLPADNPFWTLPNVIITPHAAGRSNKEFDRLCDLFVDNLGRWHRGESLRNAVPLPKIEEP